MRKAPIQLLSVILVLAFLCEPTVAQRRRRRRSLRDDAAVKAAFKDPAAAAVQSTVRVLVNGKAVGLGCIVSEDGEILTKASLVTKGDVTIRTADGKTVAAERQGTVESFDVILLKAASGTYTALEFATTAPGVGRFVAAPTELGVILGVGLVTVDVKTAGLRRRGNAPERPTAYLGLQLDPAEGGGLVVIATVETDSPSYRYGFRKDDKIMSFDGFKVNAVNDLIRILKKHKPRDSVEVRVIRNGENKKSTVRLGTRPGIDQWGGGPFSERRYNLPKVITHDIDLQPEECGGPLVTATGEVVGLNIARALRVATYAVPGDAIQGILSTLRPKVSSAPKPDIPNAAGAGNAVGAVKSAVGKTVLSVPAPESMPPSLKIPVPRVTVDRRTPVTPATDLDASGVDGTLLIYSGIVPEVAIDRFISVGQREQSRVVVIDAGGDQQPAIKALKAAWTKAKGETFHRINVATKADANEMNRLKVLDNATAIWIAPGVPAVALTGTKLSEKLDALRQDCPIATDATMAADVMVGETQTKGAALLPDSLISRTGSNEALVAAALKSNPSRVNYQLADGTALVIRGRYVAALGGSVTATFAPSEKWLQQSVQIEGRKLADLTALRRTARRRSGPVFPPAQPEAPNVQSGTLMIVGGGGLPRGLTGRFLAEAGGKDAVIAIVPISMPASQMPERDGMAEYFKSQGAKEVHVLKQRTPVESDSPEVLDILKRTTGIWFGGGRQWRFIDAYEGTQAAALMHDVLKRGGVIGGSSAGASIQGDYMARGNPLGSNTIMADGYEIGLRFLKGVAIDQHFTQRNRLQDMTGLMARYPQLLGIGIDERTAIIVKKNVAEVVGQNRVCFYDRRKPLTENGPDYEAVTAGDKYDLVARKILSPESE